MAALQLSLEIEEINKILNALGKEPYMEVFQLIQKIQEQAHPQLQKMQTENGQKVNNTPPVKVE